MIRIVLAALLLGLSAPAADKPALEGKWRLALVLPTGESNQMILKVDAAGASVVFVPPRGKQEEPPKPEIRDFKAAKDSVSFVVRQFGNDVTFVGTPSSDGKTVLGSYGTAERVNRAKLAATDKDKLERGDVVIPGGVEAFFQAMGAQSKPLQLQSRARQEKDAEKRKELLAEATAARVTADVEVPKLYREIVASHADAPAAYDSAMALLALGSKAKVTADEAAKLAAVAEKAAAPYGPRFARQTLTQLAAALSADKALASVALPVAEKAVAGLADADPAAYQVDVLGTLKAALTNAGKVEEVKKVEARLAKLESKLDAEYEATVPPFKPELFKARKDEKANKVAVLELFTGAQCPPCVAADVAFDALGKTFKPTELVLIQYHMHIPGPDPLTNLDSIARWDYYRKLFGSKVGGTPTTIFNGTPQAGGGGGMANAKTKYTQYREVIDPILESASPVGVKGSAARTGNTIEVAAEVTGAGEKDEYKVRFVLVEESVKYVGGNKLRFHHHVVRALPGGAAGAPVKAGASKHTASVDVAAIKAGLTKYLDGYAEERPFPKPERPMDMAKLRVIALVQNDATGEIVQAAEFAVSEKVAGN